MTDSPDLARHPPWIALREPLAMFRKKRVECFIFIIVNLAVGLLGVHIAWVLPLFSPVFTFGEQVTARLDGGDLYTFTIALLTSTLVLLVQGYSLRTLQRVRDLKFQTIVLAVVAIAFAAVCAGAQAILSASQLPVGTGAYVVQLLIFIGGVITAIYCFLVAIYEQDLDDFAATETARREQLRAKAEVIENDGRGMDI